MEHILLIEDNLVDIALIQSYLRDASFTHRLHKAKSLQEGLDLIRHNTIDIILLDLALDDSAGFNTLRMLLQEVPAIPVVVLTGTSNEVLGMQIVRAGAQDYLVKGNFDGKQLMRAIRHSMKRFKSQVELRKELWEAQRRDKRYQLLHSLLQIGSWEMDLLENRMQWSPEMFHLLGYHLNSFEPKLTDYLRIVHLEDRDAIKDFFQEAMRHSKPMQIEHRAVIGNRIVKHLCLKAQVISEESNDKLILVGTLQDLTEIKMTQNGNLPSISTPNTADSQIKIAYNLRQLTDKLLQALKMLESGGIVKQREHLGYAKELVAQQVDLIYQQISTAVNNSSNLATCKEVIPFATWKSRIIAMTESELQSSNKVPVLEWEHPLPERMMVDEHLLSLLLFNLIRNGVVIEANEPLHIRVGVAQTMEAGTNLRLILNTSNETLAIHRTKEYMIFLQEFLQKKVTSSPKILNGVHQYLMSLAKILHALDAEISILSEQHIEITIPLETLQKETQAIPYPINILIVEHQTIVQIALKRMLQAGIPDITIDFAENVSNGIQKLLAKNYDLVLVDVQLPATEPVEIIKALKAAKDVTLIALASEFSTADKTALRSLGVETFLTKPPQRDALLQSVQNRIPNLSQA